MKVIATNVQFLSGDMNRESTGQQEENPFSGAEATGWEE